MSGVAWSVMACACMKVLGEAIDWKLQSSLEHRSFGPIPYAWIQEFSWAFNSRQFISLHHMRGIWPIAIGPYLPALSVLVWTIASGWERAASPLFFLMNHSYILHKAWHRGQEMPNYVCAYLYCTSTVTWRHLLFPLMSVWTPPVSVTLFFFGWTESSDLSLAYEQIFVFLGTGTW